MSRFRVSLWPTLATLVGLSILLSLGTWQSLRYLEKSADEAQRDERRVLALSDIHALSDLGPALDYRQVRVHGRVDPAHTFLIKHRTHLGKPGFWLISALVLDGQQEMLLVNRGWLPYREGRELAQGLRGSDEEVFVGLVHTLERVIADQRLRERIQVGTIEPEELVELDTYDLTAILGTLPMPTTTRPVIITLTDAHSGAPYPIASTDQITAPYLTADKHLGYATTWYTMALALLAMFIAYGMGMLRSRAMAQPDAQ
ncbi:MAG: SURF1 family protein [Bradymonadaceae bacterium]|nr:SURF1 family protein [Lujinxingiaceae bacterium]